MMPLAPADVLVIVATCLGCSTVVALIALLLLRRLRHRPLFVQLLVATIAAVLAVATSVLAISVQMYLSEHDLTVLVWVLLTACVCGALVAWALARSVRATVGALTAAAQRIGSGEQLDRGEAGADEFSKLSRELVDVSDRVREAREELEQLDSARRRFFAWISHDLRTPLAALRVTAEAASAEHDARTRELAAEVEGRVRSMTRLVDDLFELSQLSSGALRLRPEHLDLLDLVSDGVADLRAAADERGVRIVAEGVAGQMLWADPRRLSRIVANLLSNAIRHAPPASDVVITVERLPEGRVVLGVLDAGAGVATADLDRMFDVGWRDERAPRAPAPEAIAPGAGLGLAIARGLARAHGGDLIAERLEAGFRMNVVLPVGERRENG
ncbi:sensor histidine kinase [Leucobacter zeae]|nr:sensor histidine kinase [Leucobacter zeae]